MGRGARNASSFVWNLQLSRLSGDGNGRSVSLLYNFMAVLRMCPQTIGRRYVMVKMTDIYADIINRYGWENLKDAKSGF